MKTKHIYTILFSLFLLNSLHARVRDYESTRLMSTAGAGVASILMDESALLNPAPVAFFNGGSFYVQKSDAKHEVDSIEQEPFLFGTDEYERLGVIVSDTSGKTIKGSVSYQKQTEAAESRNRFSATFAWRKSENTSYGMTVHRTKDVNFLDGHGSETAEDSYTQLVVGTTHVINPNFSIGVTVVDPNSTKVEDTKALTGFQYVYQDYIYLMFDAGLNYKAEEVADSVVWKAAAQLMFLKDVFARVGTFTDKYMMERGEGFGVSWVSPRLVFDIAQKNTRSIGTPIHSAGRIGKTKETSLSISYKF